MSKTCQSTPDWDAYQDACEESQSTLNPEHFFGCNPYGNAAQNELLAKGGSGATTGTSVQTADSCYQQVGEKFAKNRQINDNNLTADELSEWGAYCALGAIPGIGMGAPFLGVGAGAGAAIGCVGGILVNELGEILTDTFQAGAGIYECSTEQSAIGKGSDVGGGAAAAGQGASKTIAE